MKKIVDEQIKGRIRVRVFDDDTAQIDGLVSGRIINVDIDRPQTNSNGKVFYVASIETVDGENGTAIVWEDLLYNYDFNDIAFSHNNQVKIAVRLKGENKGNAVIEWPLTGVDEELSECEFENNEENEIVEQDINEDLEEWELSCNKDLEIKSYSQEQSTRSLKSKEIQSPSTTTTKDSKNEETGCIKIFLIFVLSFFLIGLILSPLSFLGFLLYPFWVGGAILLTAFLAKVFNNQ